MESNRRLDVLVVEDDPEALEGVLDVLRLEGFHVRGAHDGAEALGLLKSGATPCLLLLDLTMPQMDGWEFCRELESAEGLSEQARGVPIAVFTGFEIDTVGQLPNRRHDAGFIQKPVDVEKLIELVKRYCLEV
jgi:CheY-like chemotaxis protein